MAAEGPRQAAGAGLGPLAQSVRRHDPDRFFAALFAPPARRETLWLLYAFNHELARAREVASEPTLALIRLHWWREVVAQGARRRHEVAGPLGAALDAGALPADLLAGMIDAREAEAADAIATRADWLAYLDGTAGALAAAAGRALGASPALLARLRMLGTAYGIAGQLRGIFSLARQGRCLLPRDLLGAHGLIPEAVVARPDDPRLAPVRADLAAEGARLLRAAGGAMPRDTIAAALPSVLARRDLRRPGPPLPRGFGDKLAVVAAYALGRV